MIIAAYILVGIQICVALFQLALTIGAPMGEYTMGGQNIGKLPLKFRVGASISMLVNLAIAGHYLAQTGVVKALLPAQLNLAANWSLVAFTAVGLTMNAISRSKKERNLWVPVLIVSLICSILVAAGVAMNNAA